MLDKEQLESLKKDKDNWYKSYNNNNKRDVDFKTISNIDVPPLSTPEDLVNLDFKKDIGYPGTYPYTRGVHNTMYRGKLWTMRQFAGFG